MPSTSHLCKMRNSPESNILSGLELLIEPPRQGLGLLTYRLQANDLQNLKKKHYKTWIMPESDSCSKMMGGYLLGDFSGLLICFFVCSFDTVSCIPG